MQFAGIENPFGTAVTVAPTSIPSSTHYYKGVRLEKKPSVRIPRAPKPPSHYLRDFLLNF